MSARVVALSSQKGGVGKTTTAVNLAVGLARVGRRVLLVDLDPQANATAAILGDVLLGATVYHVLTGHVSIDDAIHDTTQPELDILPSDIDLAGAEVELVSAIGGQTRLRARLVARPLPYEYVVIDSPPSLGLLTINAIAAADVVYVPVSASFFALKGIARLEETIEEVRANLNRPDLAIGGVLVTMADNTRVSADVIAEVRARYGPLAFETIIPRNVKLEESHSSGMSIYSYAPKSAGALAYTALVEEVLSRA